jgi:hypothetical protein
MEANRSANRFLRKENKMSSEVIFQRLALLAEFSRRAKLGRTAIMKLMFFLQERMGVPLNYQFSLYSYGPFDSDVLADISTAERLNVLRSSVEYYPSGTGYLYEPGPEAQSVNQLAGNFLDEHRDSIEWVLANFSRKTAGELELLSTILFVVKYQNPKTVSKLIEQVGLVKPHFSQEHIRRAFDELVALEVFRTGAAR